MKKQTSSGFTIVELLVVIVVIGILAAVTIVSYTGISQKAIAASLQSDLSGASNKLKMYQVEYGSYPTGMSGPDANGTLCPSAPNVDTKYCIKPTLGNSFNNSNYAGGTQTFSLTVTNTSSNTSYVVTHGTVPTLVATLNCPTGFIPVPGSITYGTSNFCVMKYEAKADNGSGVGDTSQTTGYNTWPANNYPISSSRKLVSTAVGYPVTLISQTDAITASISFVRGCTSGCHLITEAEWMTIAQNVLSVNENWSSGTVGTGCIFRGNSGLTDSCGYSAGVENGTGRNIKASLKLTNGEVIWDLSGNIWEWTTGTSTGGEPGITGGGSGYMFREWTDVTNHGAISPDPSPSSTGITGSSSWNSANGIGKIYSNADETVLRSFIRGGAFTLCGNVCGVLSVTMTGTPDYTYIYLGLRVSR